MVLNIDPSRLLPVAKHGQLFRQHLPQQQQQQHQKHPDTTWGPILRNYFGCNLRAARKTIQI
jgi:hypothetical protein